MRRILQLMHLQKKRRNFRKFSTAAPPHTHMCDAWRAHLINIFVCLQAARIAISLFLIFLWAVRACCLVSSSCPLLLLLLSCWMLCSIFLVVRRAGSRLRAYGRFVIYYYLSAMRLFGSPWKAYHIIKTTKNCLFFFSLVIFHQYKIIIIIKMIQ